MAIQDFLRDQFGDDEERCFLYMRWYFATHQPKKDPPTMESFLQQQTVDQFLSSLINVFRLETKSGIKPLSYLKWLKGKYGAIYRRRISRQSFQQLLDEYNQLLRTRFDEVSKMEYAQFIIQRFGELDIAECLQEKNLQDFFRQRATPAADAQSMQAEIEHFGSDIFRTPMGGDQGIASRSNNDEPSRTSGRMNAVVNGNGNPAEPERKSDRFVASQKTTSPFQIPTPPPAPAAPSPFGSLGAFTLNGSISGLDDLDGGASQPPVPSEYDDIRSPNEEGAIAQWRVQGNLLARTGSCYFCNTSLPLEVTRKSRDYPTTRTIFGHTVYDPISIKLGQGEASYTTALDLNLRPMGICPTCLVALPSADAWLSGGGDDEKDSKDKDKDKESDLPPFLQSEALTVDPGEIRSLLTDKRVDRAILFGNVMPDAKINTFSPVPIRMVIAIGQSLVETQSAILPYLKPRFRRLAIGNIIRSLFQKVYIDIKYRGKVLHEDWSKIRQLCVDYVADDLEQILRQMREESRAKAATLNSNPSAFERHELKFKAVVENEKRNYVLNMYRVAILDMLENQTSRETERYREAILYGRGGVTAPSDLKQLLKAATEERDTIRGYMNDEPKKLIEGRELKWMLNL